MISRTARAEFLAYRAEVERLLGRRLVKWELRRAQHSWSHRYRPDVLVNLIRSGR